MARLLGIRDAIREIVIEACKADIVASSYGSRYKLKGYPKNSYDRDQSFHWTLRCSEINFELIKYKKELNENLSSIRIFFPNTSKLDSLIKSVAETNFPEAEESPADLAYFEQLTAWQNNQLNYISTYIDTSFVKNLDNLYDYLQNDFY